MADEEGNTQILKDSKDSNEEDFSKPLASSIKKDESSIDKKKKEKLPELTDEQKMEFRTKYKAYIPNEVTPMLHKDFGTCIRSLGFTPTEHELKLMLDDADPERLGWIGEDDFLQQMKKVIQRAPPTNQQVREAFRTFDKDNDGFIPTSKLRHILTSIGEALSEVEIDELIRYSDANADGMIRYDKFVELVFDADPEALNF